MKRCLLDRGANAEFQQCLTDQHEIIIFCSCTSLYTIPEYDRLHWLSN